MHIQRTEGTTNPPETLPTINISVERLKWRLILSYLAIIPAGIIAELLVELLQPSFRHPLRPVLGFFQLGLEQSLPTWYSSVLFFLCAAALAAIAFDHRARAKKHYGYWALLAFVFLFLGLDELYMLHERSGNLLSGQTEKTGSLRGHEWVYIYGLAVPLVGLVFAPFLRKLPPWFRNRAIIAGALFVFAAWGLEIASAVYRKHFGTDWIDWSIWITEECLETACILYFLIALLRYCLRNNVRIGLAFDQ